MMFKHILLPTDGSSLSEKGVKRGILFAKRIKARVTTIHVVPEFRSLADEALLPTSSAANLRERFIQEAQKRGERIVERVAKWAKASGVRCKCIIVPRGLPYEHIIDTARREKCDLIFMSSHGRRGLSSVLLGSETAKVLTHSKIPVLVVR
jgi:nucleotide-binding universal stress UspA family protein